MTYRKTKSTSVAAAKASFSAATGYRIENDPRLPSQKKSPRTRRRADPLGDLFETEILPMLEAAPALRPVAIFEESLHELGFIKRKENVIFLGPPGVGKTHLAISLVECTPNFGPMLC